MSDGSILNRYFDDKDTPRDESWREDTLTAREVTTRPAAEVFRDLPEGLKLKLTDGALAEIVGNPRDGAILLLKILEHPNDPSRVGGEEAVFYTDVKEVVD